MLQQELHAIAANLKSCSIKEAQLKPN